MSHAPCAPVIQLTATPTHFHLKVGHPQRLPTHTSCPVTHQVPSCAHTRPIQLPGNCAVHPQPLTPAAPWRACPPPHSLPSTSLSSRHPHPRKPCHSAAPSHAVRMHIPPYPQPCAAHIHTAIMAPLGGWGGASTRSCPREYTPVQPGGQTNGVAQSTPSDKPEVHAQKCIRCVGCVSWCVRVH